MVRGGDACESSLGKHVGLHGELRQMRMRERHVGYWQLLAADGGIIGSVYQQAYLKPRGSVIFLWQRYIGPTYPIPLFSSKFSHTPLSILSILSLPPSPFHYYF